MLSAPCRRCRFIAVRRLARTWGAVPVRTVEPDPNTRRTPGYGHAAQHRTQPPSPDGSHQHRRRPATPRPRWECSDDLAESSSWNRDFEVVMLASDASDEQIEGPPGRDVPRGRDTPQSLRDFSGSPCRPEPVAFLLGELMSSHLRWPLPRCCVRRVCDSGIGRRHTRARPGAGRSPGANYSNPLNHHPGPGSPASRTTPAGISPEPAAVRRGGTRLGRLV
jgi:hypothetical protein